MKIRNGFVSNSSSSSFMIFGKIITTDELKRIFNFTDKDVENIWDYEGNAKLKYFSCKCVDDGKKWLIGSKLGGNGSSIIGQVFDTEKELSGGCKLYSGMDHDGELEFDDEDD